MYTYKHNKIIVVGPFKKQLKKLQGIGGGWM
jgi:hypothetical protein